MKLDFHRRFISYEARISFFHTISLALVDLIWIIRSHSGKLIELANVCGWVNLSVYNNLLTNVRGGNDEERWSKLRNDCASIYNGRKYYFIFKSFLILFGFVSFAQIYFSSFNYCSKHVLLHFFAEPRNIIRNFDDFLTNRQRFVSHGLSSILILPNFVIWEESTIIGVAVAVVCDFFLPFRFSFSCSLPRLVRFVNELRNEGQRKRCRRLSRVLTTRSRNILLPVVLLHHNLLEHTGRHLTFNLVATERGRSVLTDKQLKSGRCKQKINK